MKIGEIAGKAGVSVDTVRFYERVGVLPAPARTASGYRDYQPDTVRRIQLTRELQAIGFTLGDAVDALAAHDAGGATCESEHWRLQAVLDRVDAKLAELRSLRRRIVSAQQACASGHCMFATARSSGSARAAPAHVGGEARRDRGAPEVSELRLSRRFAAAPERVFEAWTDPAVLRRWWAAHPAWDGPAAEADARAGGRYRLSMTDPSSGETRTLAGEYAVVERPSRLVYTWRWEGTPAETVVTVEFHAEGDGTRVELHQAGFPDAQDRDMHADGWGGCLDNLARRVFSGG